MKKLKKISIILMILISFLIAPKVFAKSNNDEIRKVEYSEDFKRWLKLSDEEKNKTIDDRKSRLETEYEKTESSVYSHSDRAGSAYRCHLRNEMV